MPSDLHTEYLDLRAEIAALRTQLEKIESGMPSLRAGLREMQAAQEQQARELETHLGFAEREEDRQRSRDEREEARHRSRNSPIHRAIARAWANVFPPDVPDAKGEAMTTGYPKELHKAKMDARRVYEAAVAEAQSVYTEALVQPWQDYNDSVERAYRTLRGEDA
ncbi:MAG: hypothetical protein NUW01_13660 [Gemmatimonadaceae bacterium]|nr:hypothetical protein [Gemmatimonadaceae bacterium]